MRLKTTLLVTCTSLLLVIGPAGLALADGDDEDRDEPRGKGDGKDRGDAEGEGRGKGEGRGEGRGKGGDHAKPRFERHGSDKWLLRNDEVAVWFHAGGNGKAKPDLRVFHADEDGNVSGYRVSIKHLLEVSPRVGDDDEDDKDGDALDGLRVHNRINLARKDDWNVQTEETNDSLHITMVRAEAQGIVTLVFHVNKTAPAVKFDLHVDNWEWAANATDHRLALVMVVHERDLKRVGDGRNATLDGGYVSWAPTADVSYGAVSRAANVTALMGDEEGGKHGRIALLFDAPGGYESLVYDPEFGVLSTATSTVAPVPAPAALAAVAAVGAAAVAVAGRRRRA